MDLSARQCDNCHTSLQGDFCHQCGQEKKSYIRNVSGVVTEFFGEFSNWDTRVWRTLVPLWFRPGFLSRRYVQGHRVPYVPPLRLYLFTSIIAFLLFAQLMPESVGTVNIPKDNAQLAADGITAEQAESISGLLSGINEGVKKQGPTDNDLMFLSDDDKDIFYTKLDAITANPKLAINKFFSLAPQMMFGLLPLFALLLKLLYIRSERYYTEHLIVALHSHSFILQFSVLYLALQALAAVSWPWLVPPIEWLATATLIWIPTYLLLCQKFYYQQSWGKTLLKFWLTSSLYNILFMSAIVGLIILSILWS
ncbi:Protein of unknown function [Rheinheimera pacifica]|uniref:DUF3667 domain-containing protein n=1 Tax=Rheinheimera pacifica TaxID=173990 RepID=A0A1H6NIJ5_9GAMM|nr:DUF3667 domain-containing protein [Rheinheimera pacifica]SEI11920.1 Protein of unknown function [Rheinheimera pacifica]